MQTTDVDFCSKITVRSLVQARDLLTLSLLAFVLCLPASPVSAQQSLIMPRASEALLLDVVRAGDRLIAAGDYGLILFSDDEGETWEQAKVPTRRALTALSFPDPARGWAVGHDGLILATIDGGLSWVVQRDGLKAQQRINEEKLERLQGEMTSVNQALSTCEEGDQMRALRASAEELEFEIEYAQEILEEPVNAPPLLDVYFVDEMRGVAVGAFNTLLRTVDGGLSWIASSELLDNPDEFHLNAVTGDGSGRLWIAAEGGLLYRSDEGGASWDRLETPYHGSWFGIIRAPGTNVLVVFGLRGNVFRSEDGGDSWQRVETTSDRTLAGGLFVNDNYALLVGAAGTLLVSDDSAKTFRQIPSGQRHHLSAVASIADIALLVGQGGVHRVAPFGGQQ